MTIGDTGSGKSTLNNSLVFGAESLEVKTISETIEVQKPDGSSKAKKKSRKVIATKFEKDVFKIGHSKSQSMTFLPDFEEEQDTKYLFGDLAGFFDTGGSLIDLVNCFITKKIFQKANTVKLILVLTATQIEQNRGQAVKDTLRVIQNICKGDLIDTIKSVQPILSMCKPNSEVDIETIQNILYQFGDKEMNNMQRSSQFSMQTTSIRQSSFEVVEPQVIDEQQEIDN